MTGHLASLTDSCRPRRFAEVIGQPAAVARLQARLRTGHVGPLLLHGPAGTGKTSLARIAASALLCEAPGSDGEPCGRCWTCRSFEQCPPSPSSDYLELNASEYSGLNAAQDIAQHVRSLPLGRFKLVVLDEMQGLSPRAADALLTHVDGLAGAIRDKRSDPAARPLRNGLLDSFTLVRLVGTE